MPKIRPRDDKELIFFAILFVLNVLCDIIHDVIDKRVYVWWIWLIGQLDSFGNDWLQLLQWRVVLLNNISTNVLSTIDILLSLNCKAVRPLVHKTLKSIIIIIIIITIIIITIIIIKEHRGRWIEVIAVYTFNVKLARHHHHHFVLHHS